MNGRRAAVVKEVGGWWIGWIEEVPGVNCQEATREELLESLENRRSAIPRHREINDHLARKICRDPDVDEPDGH